MTKDNPPASILLSPTTTSPTASPPSLPADAQRLRLLAAADLPLAELTFWLNEEPLATLTAAPYEFWWPLTLGQFTLTVTGRTPTGELVQGAAVQFTVREQE
ncbi:MAG: hypothetical protein IPL28_07635 [Chloroflexi bacterium]|nr:hypothetical protein [Chloroflexota bacterium]